MDTNTTAQAAQIKCRTCFALINANEQRCPKCRAPQNWRRHITVVNALAGAMVALVIGALIVLVPWMSRLDHPIAQVALQTSFHVDDIDFIGDIMVSNTGEQQVLVQRIIVQVSDGENKALTYLVDERTWGEPFTIAPGAIGKKVIRLGQGPGRRSNPVTRVALYHLDGTSQQLVDSTHVTMGISSVAHDQ